MKKIFSLMILLLLSFYGCFNENLSNQENQENLGVINRSISNFSSSYSNVYFRGTCNSWGKTEMSLIADNTWETVQEFKTGDSSGGPRFKIDIYGNWTNSYPYSDQSVSSNKTFRIEFNDISKRITYEEFSPIKGDLTINYSVSTTDESLKNISGLKVIIAGKTYTISESQSLVENINQGNYSITINDTKNINGKNYRYQSTGSFIIKEGSEHAVVNLQLSVEENKIFSKNYTSVYYRGTTNSWNKTKMELVADNTWEIIQFFATEGGYNGPRFKVDVSGNWTKSYPYYDYKVNKNTNYKITFNDLSNTVSAEEVSDWKNGTAIIEFISESENMNIFDGENIELKKENTIYTEATVHYDTESLKTTLQYSQLEEGTYNFELNKTIGYKIYTVDSSFDISETNPTYGAITTVAVEKIIMDSFTIDTTSAQIEFGTEYSLPQSGTATLSNGTQEQLTVVWDKEVNTSTEGAIEYIGTATLEEVSKSVSFTLNVIKTVMTDLTINKTSATVFVGDTYTLPTTGTAIMSDNTNKEVTLTWDKTVNTSTAGAIKYTGTATIKDLTKSVNFNLTVNEILMTDLTIELSEDSVLKGETYILPLTGTATMNNLTNQEITLNWNKDVNTTTVGIIEYIGTATIGNVTKSVTFTLTIYEVIITKLTTSPLEANVLKGTPYTLPLTGTATMSDNTNKEVNLTWDKVVNTNIVGTIEYIGIATIGNISKSVTFKLTVYEITMTNLKINKTSDTVSVGEPYTLPTTGTATMSDNTNKEVSLTWDKVVNTNISGTTLYTGSTDLGNKTVTFTLKVLNGVTVYVEEGYGDALYAWTQSKKEPLGSWPGSTLTEKSGKFLKHTFEGEEEINYIILKNRSKKTGDEYTNKDIWWDKYGTKHSQNPYDESPSITVSPVAGKYKGNKTIFIIVSGDNISNINADFDGSQISFDGMKASFLISDYISNGSNGTLTITATNSSGTKNVTENYTRDDSFDPNAIDIYGTLEPMAERAMYFLMTDRFVNGDTSNDNRNQGSGTGWSTWNRAIGSANIGYQGGDFKGILDNVDYIKDMGFGSIWLSPILDNPDEAFSGGNDCYWGASIGSDKGKTGYHGYWASNFYQVDEHWESTGISFSELTDKLKDEDIKTVLDIVTNHANPAFGMDSSQYNRSKFGKVYDENGNLKASSNNRQNGHTWFQGNDQIAQLADFNPYNDDVFEYLVNAYLKWIGEGADAFRIDTIKHMPMSFWKKFSDRIRSEYPDFYMFGEAFSDDLGLLASFQRPSNGGISVLDFIGMYAMKNVFGGYGGYDGLSGYLHLNDGSYTNEYELVTFYDNHDMARLNANDSGFIDAHNWLFTTRGIPCVYYGSEMGFQRGAGEHTGNRNYYGESNISNAKNSNIYKELSEIGNIRKNSPALQKGIQINVELSGNNAMFFRVYQHDGVNQTALVMLNKSSSSKTMSTSQYVSSGVWVDAETNDMINSTGTISVSVPAHGVKVLLYNEAVENISLLNKCKDIMGN